MGATDEFDDRPIRIAMLRATFEASSHAQPSHAVAARSRALLDLMLALLENQRSESRRENRDS